MGGAFRLRNSLMRALAISAAPVRGPPLVVKQTPSAGRGVFATRDIAEGELIVSTEPVVSHSKLEHVSRVCYYCLKEIVELRQKLPGSSGSSIPVVGPDAGSRDLSSSFQGAANSRRQANFCSIQCAANAEKFLVVERRANWSDLEKYCREYGFIVPLVARRLACMVVAGTLPADALEILSYNTLPDGRPSHWNDERSLLRTALQNAGVQLGRLEFLPKDWYSEVISRINTNAFFIEMIRASPSLDRLEAATSSVSEQGSIGSVCLYILPSMFNHDCDPNVNMSWPCNSTIQLAARQNISAGKELRITYVDSSMAYDARQEILRDSYGFLCDCLRCRHRA